MISESTLITKGNASIGRSSSVSVIKAIVASAVVRPIVPVSERKNLAGGILNQRNAHNAPVIARQNAAKSPMPILNAITLYAPKMIANTPPAKPSIPSITPPA